MHELSGTIFHRWYVTIFGLSFLYFAVRQLGWRKTMLYAVLAFGVGALAENGSVHAGFPYTSYAFNPALRGKELWVGDVPIFVPLSYTFMGYFAFAAGRLLASGPWRTRARHWWMEFLMAWMLAVWALWVVDPVSRLGDDFYLGRVFNYRGPGFWFGLPLMSQLGFALTSLVLLALLFTMTRGEPDRPVRGGVLRHPHLGALITWHAQVFHMAVIAFVVGADAIGGSALLMWIPAACVTAVFWSTISPRARVRAAAEVDAASADGDRQVDEAAHEARTEPLGVSG
ncbi:MAG: rane protein [Acidimicrobiales bacterium]|nr:rane protein [Acidimicrobiales bacterium]